MLRQLSVLFYILRAPRALFHLDPRRWTSQFMIHIRCSELIYRYRDKISCALLVRSRRRGGYTPFSGCPAPSSVCYYEPLTLVLHEGNQLFEKFRERALLPSVRIHSQTSPSRFCLLFPQLLVTSSLIFHEFTKEMKVRSTTREIAHSFQVRAHSCIPCLTFLPCIHYSRLSAIFRSQELWKSHVIVA